MTDDQGRLSLEDETKDEMQRPRLALANSDVRGGRDERTGVATTPQQPPDIRPRVLEELTNLDRVRKAIGRRGDGSLKKALSDLDKSISAIENVEHLLHSLRQAREELAGYRDNVLGQRRQLLTQDAIHKGWHVSGNTGTHYVGCFEVSYQNEWVKVQVGSEPYARIHEVDGINLFTSLADAQTTLENVVFDSQRFFCTLKQAILWAKAQGLGAYHNTNAVPIRDLYPVIVLVRQSRDNKHFFTNPSRETFCEYSTAQLVYDLARYLQHPWRTQTEQLKVHQPNMLTIRAKKHVRLPRLSDHHARRINIGALEIVKNVG